MLQRLVHRIFYGHDLLPEIIVQCAVLSKAVEAVIPGFSEHELAAVLDGDTLETFVRRHKIKEMIVTRGARGASILSRGQWDEIVPTRILDGRPVGAGDVFLGTYLMLRVEGRDPASAGRGATRASMAQIERGEVPSGFVPDAHA